MLAVFGLLGGGVGSFAFVVLDLALGGFAGLALADASSSWSAQCTTHSPGESTMHADCRRAP